MTVEEHDITSETVREQMRGELGRVATPAILVDGRLFWGFDGNQGDIADLLGITLQPPTSGAVGESA